MRYINNEDTLSRTRCAKMEAPKRYKVTDAEKATAPTKTTQEITSGHPCTKVDVSTSREN